MAGGGAGSPPTKRGLWDYDDTEFNDEFDISYCNTDSDEESTLMHSILKAREDIFKEEEEEEEEEKASKPVETRGSKKGVPKSKTDCMNSEFARMLRDDHEEMLQHDKSKQGRFFRRCFRVPYPLFHNVLVPHCSDAAKEVFSPSRSVPVEIKLLIALRIIALSSSAHDCIALSRVSESYYNRIFREFVTNYSKHYYHDFVRFPEVGSKELERNMEIYRKLGFPGCIGSIDGTHIPWEMCPENLHFECSNGKEMCKTVSFQCAVSHDRFVYHISGYFHGKHCDMTTVRNDPVLQAALFSKFKDVLFLVYDKDGNEILMQGGWFLTDNGYPISYTICIRPLVVTTNALQLYFKEFSESVRKDVECFFGVTKQRFRFLKYAVLYHDPDIIEAAFKVAGILHNMLLVYDGYVHMDMESIEEEFKNLDPKVFSYIPEDEPKDAVNEDRRSDIVNKDNGSEVEAPGSEVEAPGSEALVPRKIMEMSTFNRLARPGSLFMSTLGSPKVMTLNSLAINTGILVANFNFMWQIGEIFWPKGKDQPTYLKNRLGVWVRDTDAIVRLKRLVHQHLYTEKESPTTLRRGLYSKVDLFPGKPVAFFNGVLCIEKQFQNSKFQENFAKLPIGIPPFYIQYEDIESKNACFALKSVRAGSPDNVDINCSLHVDPKLKEAFLYANRKIPTGRAVTWF